MFGKSKTVLEYQTKQEEKPTTKYSKKHNWTFLLLVFFLEKISDLKQFSRRNIYVVMRAYNLSIFNASRFFFLAIYVNDISRITRGLGRIKIAFVHVVYCCLTL